MVGKSNPIVINDLEPRIANLATLFSIYLQARAQKYYGNPSYFYSQITRYSYFSSELQSQQSPNVLYEIDHIEERSMPV